MQNTKIMQVKTAVMLGATGLIGNHLLQFLLQGSLRKYRAVEAEDVARAMLAAAHLEKQEQHIYEYPQIKNLSGSWDPS